MDRTQDRSVRPASKARRTPSTARPASTRPSSADRPEPGSAAAPAISAWQQASRYRSNGSRLFQPLEEGHRSSIQVDRLGGPAARLQGEAEIGEADGQRPLPRVSRGHRRDRPGEPRPHPLGHRLSRRPLAAREPENNQGSVDPAEFLEENQLGRKRTGRLFGNRQPPLVRRPGLRRSPGPFLDLADLAMQSDPLGEVTGDGGIRTGEPFTSLQRAPDRPPAHRDPARHPPADRR